MKHAAYLTKEFLREIEENLKTQEKDLLAQIKQVSKEDPFLNPDRSSSRSAEYIEEAGEEIGHERVEVQKGILQKQLQEVRLALTKLEKGTYGICENCGQPIDRARLEASPQARYCLDCEKKLGKDGRLMAT